MSQHGCWHLVPHDIGPTLLFLIQTGKVAEVVKRVTELTGAGLCVSKDYVDGLVKPR
jgi:ribosomal protein L7/L12